MASHLPSLLIGTGFRTGHIHFPLFVRQRSLRGINFACRQMFLTLTHFPSFFCQHRLLEQGIHAFLLSFNRAYVHFRSCNLRDPVTKACNRVAWVSWGQLCDAFFFNEMHFSVRQIVLKCSYNKIVNLPSWSDNEANISLVAEWKMHNLTIANFFFNSAT